MQFAYDPTLDAPNPTMPVKRSHALTSVARAPQLDLDQWLPQLVDHFMSAWNEKLAQDLKQVKLTFPQWRILLIATQRGPLSIRQLSNATLVPHSTLARWARRMERSGLVRTRTMGADKRAVEVSIAPKGADAFAKALPIAISVYRKALEGFSEVEQQRLIGMIHRLRTNIGMS